MRLSRLLFAALLVAAPVAPLALSAAEPPMKCCPLHEGGAACCPVSSCSLSRCAPPAPPAFTALPPCVVPDRSSAIAPAVSGRLPSEADFSPLSLASDLPDPPPRA